MDTSSDITIDMFGRMTIALDIIENCLEFSALIPEVRTNMVYARPGARTTGEVLAVDGRVTVVEGMPRAAGRPRFGTSNHMARLVIGIMDVHPQIRTAINFSNTPELARWLEDYCRNRNRAFAIIDRRAEPEASRAAEGSSMSWKAQEAVRAAGTKAPWVFCDQGSFGKEPVSVIVGTDPVTAAGDVCEIARAYARRCS